jgi:hypothetical protein
LKFLHYFPHLTYSQCWMAELSLRTFDHRSNYNCTVHFNFYSKWWL